MPEKKITVKSLLDAIETWVSVKEKLRNFDTDLEQMEKELAEKIRLRDVAVDEFSDDLKREGIPGNYVHFFRNWTYSIRG